MLSSLSLSQTGFSCEKKALKCEAQFLPESSWGEDGESFWQAQFLSHQVQALVLEGVDRMKGVRIQVEMVAEVMEWRYGGFGSGDKEFKVLLWWMGQLPRVIEDRGAAEFRMYEECGGFWVMYMVKEEMWVWGAKTSETSDIQHNDKRKHVTLRSVWTICAELLTAQSSFRLFEIASITDGLAICTPPFKCH